jgi:hypothetical protein
MGRHDLADDERKAGYWFWFTEPDFIVFRREAANVGFGDDHLLVRKEFTYTRSELLGAQLLAITVRTAERGTGGPWHGTKFDLSVACPRCGTGAIQTSPLFLKRSDIPKRGELFQTLDHDLLVGLRLRDALTAEAVSGLELRQAVSNVDAEPVPWYQMISKTQLPPMSDLTRGIIRSTRDPACPVCQRDGHYDDASEPRQISYDRSVVDVEALPDVVHTYECFGRSVLKEPFEKSHFASPLLLVKPRVYVIFEKLKIRRTEFVPVRIFHR